MSPSLSASAAASWLGTWSKPPDRPAQIALAIAVALALFAIAPGGTERLASALDFAGLADLSQKRRFLLVTSFTTAFLSLAYVAIYLRGGPRAAEATTFWLQARALSHGSLSWVAPDPTANFRAAQVILVPPDRLTAAEPPGFAFLLAATFLVGAPMLIGPAIAAALVAATWALAREIAVDAGLPDARAEAVARTAAGLSVVSVTLRYLTAETVPHAAAGLAVALALTSALRAGRTSRRLYSGAGGAVGFLVATDPAASLAAGVAVVWIAARRPQAVRSIARAGIAATPGVLLLLIANRAATGHAFTSAASLYASAIAPAGDTASFRHAAAAVLRCVRLHAADVANLEPLLLLAVIPFWRRVSSHGTLVAALTVLGGAAMHHRLLADPQAAGAAAGALGQALPIEHALMALGLGLAIRGALGRAATGVFALAAAGFALHTSSDHLRRANEDLGRPRYESDVVREANVTHGLLFFDDDLGYALAYDPATPASHGVEAVRMRGDDHDRLLFDALGHPPSHRYSTSGPEGSAVTFWTPGGGSNDFWRFEAESEWPPVRQSPTGSASVEELPGACAFGGRVVAVTGSAAGPASVWLELPAPREPTLSPTRSWTVIPRVLQHGTAGAGTLTLYLTWPLTSPSGSMGEGPVGPAAQWTWSDAVNRPTCIELSGQTVTLSDGSSRAWLRLEGADGRVGLDAISLRAR
ncbi:MAG TPA: hypothetical protein VKU41_12735 [Polyangiaceae bacterium]|nr:hypothetical protein [Polyangiaceae bacterium]